MGAGSSSIKGLSVQQVLELIAEYLHSRNFTVKTAFALIDKDESGALAFDEFLQGFRMCTEGMGVDGDYPPQVLSRVFSLFDVNQDGQLNIAEFVQAFAPKSGYGTTYYDHEFYSRAGQTPGSFSFDSPAQQSSRDSRKTERQFQEELFMRFAAAIKRLGYSHQEVFAKADTDRSGRLTREEFRQLCVSVQPDLSRTELEAIFRHFDSNHSNAITSAEFSRTLGSINSEALVKVEKHVRGLAQKFKKHGHSVYDSFFVFDRDGDGLLTRDEWRRAMAVFDAGGLSADPALHEEELDFIFRRFDRDGHGCLSIADLQRFFCESVDRAQSVQRHMRPSALPWGAAGDHIRPLPEEPWETEALDAIRAHIAPSSARCGLDLSQIFQRINVSRSGALSLDEFAAVVAACRPMLGRAEVQQLFRKLDASGDSQIGYGEFVRRFG